MEDWMITSYEVKFGREIGSGGLYVFGSLSHLPSIAYLRLPSSVGKYLKGVGTRRWWHSRYL